jgi:DNA-binding GntR family transcriptional regulator
MDRVDISMQKAGESISNSFPQFETQESGQSRTGSLHVGLLDALRELINHGDLAPATRVPERSLCERFSISRTPLREALKVLAAEGLIELLPNRGARVATLDDSNLTNLFEVIGVLEGEAGRLSCARMSDAAIAEVQALHYRMYAHFLREELPEYFALNQRIHQAIIDGAGNDVLIATHRTLAGRIVRARYMSNRLKPDRWKAAIAEHEQILDALVRRDGDQLARILSQHLANKRDIIMEHIRDAVPGNEAKPKHRRRRTLRAAVPATEATGAATSEANGSRSEGRSASRQRRPRASAESAFPQVTGTAPVIIATASDIEHDLGSMTVSRRPSR